MNIEELIEKFKQGNIRALGKAITIVENDLENSDFLLEKIANKTKKSQVVGFTGSPGAGKSSLIDSLVSTLRKNNLTVGVIAIDPSSPFTGGAILGDRIRMIQHSTDKGVFIRSMANRGQTGGLSVATKKAIKVLSSFGFDLIIIETVGTGQTEIDIIKTADTVVVVQNPETGDGIQAIKAGIMEIADIFVVNKSDLKGANIAKMTLEASIHEATKKSDWDIPVVMTSSVKNEGLEALFDKIRNHFDFLNNSGELEKRRFEQTKSEIISILEEKIKHYLNYKLKENNFSDIIKQACNQEISVNNAVNQLFKKL
ncbi:MAG: methylmalonyl Co-A mutase-associated GTPase MeaB [Candidatus Sericytochromatia bacterium]